MRIVTALLFVAGASAAEVARRDLVVAVETGDGGFSYQLDSAIGSFSGEDAFDRLSIARLGGRWAWATPGSPLAPLAGVDAVLLNAPMPGGGLSGYGLELAAGGTWAFSETCATDLEGFYGLHRVSLSLPGANGAAGLAGDGLLWRSGIRARLSWHVAQHWSLAVEGGWMTWNADLTADGQRTVLLDGSGPCIGLALAWRPSARPGSIE